MSTLQVIGMAALILLLIAASIFLLFFADKPPFPDDAGRRSYICRKCGHRFHSGLACPRCHTVKTTCLTVERTIRYHSLFWHYGGRITSVCRLPADVGKDVMSVLPQGGYLLLEAKVEGESVIMLGKIVYAEIRADYVHITHDIPNMDSLSAPSWWALKAQEAVGGVIRVPVSVDDVER